jgi:hypothetical protein
MTTSSSSTVVEHSPHHFKVQGSSPGADTDTRRKKGIKMNTNRMASKSITVVEHSPHHFNVEGSSPGAATDTKRQKMSK